MLVVLSLFVAGCDRTPGDTGLGVDTDATCAADADCTSTEICEDTVCVDGDRNVDAESAEGIFWSDQVSGEINPEGDVDWYSVQAEGGEFFRIAVVTAEEDGGLDSVVTVYDAAGKVLVWEDEHPAGNVRGIDSMCYGYFAEAGTYYIKVEDKGSFNGTTPIGGPGESYTLEIIEINAIGNEPDSAQMAGYDFRTVALDTYYALPVLLQEPGDTDWAALELTAAGSPLRVISLQNGRDEFPAHVILKNEAGDDVIARTDPTYASPAYLPDPMGKKYVVGATGATGGGGADYWTWLFLVVRKGGDENPIGVEPDDTLEQANALDLKNQNPDSGAYYRAYAQGRIDPSADRDHYSMNVPFDNAYISVYVGAQPYGSLLVPRIELLDATGVVLDTVDSTTALESDALNLGPYPRGAYTVRISGAPDNGDLGGEGYFYLFRLDATSSPVAG